MSNNPGTILSRIKDEEIDWVDLRFTDPKGKWQHLTMASGIIDEDMLTDGFMFDGSSIAGWKAINESDMILKPDLDAAYVDPFSATPMMILFCNVVEPSTGELYGRDPRSTATRAEAYLKQTGIGDTVPAASRSTTSNCRPTPCANMKAATSAIAPAPRAATSLSLRSTVPWTSAARWSRR